MPYIKKEKRSQIHPTSSVIFTEQIDGPGDLNYAVTMLIKEYHKKKGLSYQTINDVMGALEGAKQEYYVRVAGVYEEQKITEHGDVFND